MLDIKALLLKLVQQYNGIGTQAYQTGTYTPSIASSNVVNVTFGSISNLAAGTWLCFGYLEWPASNATGFRAIQLAKTESGGSISNQSVSLVCIPSSNSSYGTYIQTSCAIESSKTWTLSVRGCQNSGTTITTDVDWTLKAVRIK